MTITTEHAEELSKWNSQKGDNVTSEALRALAKERDELLRSVEGYQFALAETEALEMQHGAVIARLQTTIRNLEARDIHSCGPDCQRSGCVNRRLREQLVAAQAVIEKKDEAMRAVASMTDGLEWRICDAALAIQSDDTALREMLAEQWDKAIAVCRQAEDTGNQIGIERDVAVWNRAIKYCSARISALAARVEKGEA